MGACTDGWDGVVSGGREWQEVSGYEPGGRNISENRGEDAPASYDREGSVGGDAHVKATRDTALGVKHPKVDAQREDLPLPSKSFVA